MYLHAILYSQTCAADTPHTVCIGVIMHTPLLSRIKEERLKLLFLLSVDNRAKLTESHVTFYSARYLRGWPSWMINYCHPARFPRMAFRPCNYFYLVKLSQLNN